MKTHILYYIRHLLTVKSYNSFLFQPLVNVLFKNFKKKKKKKKHFPCVTTGNVGGHENCASSTVLLVDKFMVPTYMGYDSFPIVLIQSSPILILTIQLH